MLEHAAGTGGAHPIGAEVVLHPNGDTSQGAWILASREGFIHRSRPLQGEIVGHRHEGIHLLFGGGNALQAGLSVILGR